MLVSEHSVGYSIVLRQCGIVFSNAVLRCDIQSPLGIFIADVPNLGKMLSISASSFGCINTSYENCIQINIIIDVRKSSSKSPTKISSSSPLVELSSSVMRLLVSATVIVPISIMPKLGPLFHHSRHPR